MWGEGKKGVEPGEQIDVSSLLRELVCGSDQLWRLLLHVIWGSASVFVEAAARGGTLDVLSGGTCREKG